MRQPRCPKCNAKRPHIRIVYTSEAVIFSCGVCHQIFEVAKFTEVQDEKVLTK